MKNINKKIKLNKNKIIIFFMVSVILMGAIQIPVDAKPIGKLDIHDNVFFKDKPLTKAIVYSIEQEINKQMKEKEKIRLEEERIQLEEKRRQIEIEKEAKRKAEMNRKVAYLTFDDGPTPNITPKVLDILDSYDIKATFFVVGNLVESKPELTKEIVNRGHKLGNHSYSHNYNSMYQNYDSFYADILRAEKAFKTVLGEDFHTSVVRFPGGSHGQKKGAMRNRLEKQGYKVYDWNALNGDAEGINKSVSYLRNRFISTVGNQKKPIILMHDARGKENTVTYLPEAIEYLINRGYEFDVLE